MNPDPSKLRQQQQQAEETQSGHLQEESQTAHEFASPEEMLRFDSLQTPPPERIAERLKESIALEPKPARSWWRRWFTSGP